MKEYHGIIKNYVLKENLRKQYETFLKWLKKCDPSCVKVTVTEIKKAEMH
jgi:hypothetical protein